MAATRKKAVADEGMDERESKRSERERDDEIDPFDRARLSFGKDTGEVIRVKFALCSPDGGEKHLETLEYDPEVHTEEFIRSRYGPGRYRLRFVGGSDWRYRMAFTVDLAPLPSSSSGALSSSPAPASAPSNFDLLEYFKRDSERARAEFNQLVLAVIGRPSPAGSGDSGIGKIVEVLGSQNAKLLEIMLSRSSSPAGAGAVDVVLKALELGMQTVSEAKADQEGGWVSAVRGLARDLAPVLSQLVTQRGIAPGALPGGAPAPAAVAVPPPGNVVAFPAPGSPVPPAAAVPDSVFRSMLTEYAPAVLQAARVGQAPIDFAGSVLDSVGVLYHPLFDSLTSNDLVSLQPELGQIRWIDPETQADAGLWIDLVVQLLKSRDFGEEEGA